MEESASKKLKLSDIQRSNEDGSKDAATKDPRIEKTVDRHPYEVAGNKEDVTLIWLDANIDDSDDCKQTLNMFYELNDYVQPYTDTEICTAFIRSIVDEKIFLVSSDELGRNILPQIHSLQTVQSIFIYGDNHPPNTDYFSKYSKVVEVSIKRNSLMESIKVRVKRTSKQIIAFNLFDHKQKSTRNLTREPAAFLWFQILVDVLKQLPHNIQAKEQMLDVCKNYYRTNEIELQNIERFRSRYKPEDAISWYTEGCFVYKLLNKALRTEDVYLLYLFRFYIIDLCKQLEDENQRYASCCTLYRGQLMSSDEFDKLSKNIRSLISTNGFLSTTRDIRVALMFSGGDQVSHGMKSVLFEIKVDRPLGTLVFADIERFSHFEDEKEVLFSIGATFKIENVAFDEDLKTWRVKITATDEGAESVQAHINHMRQELEETNPTRLFGKLLLDMGQYSKAEAYFRLVLDTLPKDHADFPSLYHGLGYLHYLRHEYDQALKYDTHAYKIRKEKLPPNHLDIAKSAINLGCDYERHGDYSKAMDLFKEALEIREKNYTGDHMNIALALVCIGDTHMQLGDYKNAHKYLTRGLEIYQRVLPSKHAKIVRTIIKIGHLFYKQKVYDHAIEYYLDGYKMAEDILPFEHPRLMEYFEHIVKTYEKMRNMEDALKFCNEKLTIQRELFGEVHPNIAKIHIIIGDYCSNIEQKLFEYFQALEILKKCVPAEERAIADCMSKIDTIKSLSA
ncbi:unnamed protein product [Didymodactylos carnosus]|uniref:NAD(P)(+)--arginine ADP-ribosyltransferase n=3 Tax=Didymodactylos carnosus TaxID=1234261 RepID=A0A814SLZ5_9BILA|nr:unnamed protein product [Didymodactylos carnosus]CAF3911387.1 unnamed protein product [Didymodactylos carnosus]